MLICFCNFDLPTDHLDASLQMMVCLSAHSGGMHD